MSRLASTFRSAAFILACAVSLSALAQRDFSKIDFSSEEIRPGLHVLVAEGGGNLALLTGEGGALLIDDHLQQLGAKMEKAIAGITDQPVRFLVNTHWHFDHAGGNEMMGNGGTVIVAHDNVRKRMAAGQVMAAFGTEIPPAPAAALPVLTYADGIAFHWAGDTLEVVHPDPAHTDGDSVVYFLENNVVHMGDLYFNGMYPFIDAGSGGSLSGMVKGITEALARMDDDTVVIPGHGPLSNKSELQAHRDMLDTVSKRIASLLAQGKTVEEVVAAKPTAEFDAVYNAGFFKADKWVALMTAAP